MITLKGAEVSGKIKDQVQEILENMNGYVPTAAIVRVGERPDDLSYEKGVIKKIASFILWNGSENLCISGRDF